MSCRQRRRCCDRNQQPVMVIVNRQPSRRNPTLPQPGAGEEGVILSRMSSVIGINPTPLPIPFTTSGFELLLAPEFQAPTSVDFNYRLDVTASVTVTLLNTLNTARTVNAILVLGIPYRLNGGNYTLHYRLGGLSIDLPANGEASVSITRALPTRQDMRSGGSLSLFLAVDPINGIVPTGVSGILNGFIEAIRRR